MNFKTALSAAFGLMATLLAAQASAGSFYVAAEATELTLRNYTSLGSTSRDGEGYQLRGGYQASENFSVELLYGINEDLESGTPGATGDSYYGVMVRPGAALSNWLYVTGNLGYIRGPLLEDSDSYVFGFGFEFTPLDAIAVTFDWNEYADAGDSAGGFRVEGISLGLKLRFGGDDD